MPARKKSRRLYGFTLIEVLVVIAIIGLLAGILCPVFASARAVSRKTVCQSNLRQLYVAFQLYANDWNGTLPGPGGRIGDFTYWAQKCGGGLDAYLKCQHRGLKSVYCCPCYTGQWNSPYSPRTYGMNSYLQEPPDIEYPFCLAYLTGIRECRIKVPVSTILLYEGIPEDRTNSHGEGYVDRCGNWKSVRGYYTKPQLHLQDADQPWHGSVNDYLMCDGHIMVMRPEKYGTFTVPTWGNNFWYARKLR